MVVAAAGEGLKSKVHVGDIVLAVDGEPIADRIARIKKYHPASTPQALQYRLRWQVLLGPPESEAKLKLRNPSGEIREESVPRTGYQASAAWNALNESLERKSPVYSVLSSGYGYFDLARLTVPQVNVAFEAVKGSPALILDMRGYPKDNTMWLIASRLTDKPVRGVASGGYPYWFAGPDQKIVVQSSSALEPSPHWKFTGRITVLIDGNAMSASETACCLFEEAAKGRVTFIGTPTVGANGMVTNTSMPGGITLRFTGYDARHLDGRQLQRVGILPDIRVEPTIEGIVAGKDEVLEAAIKFLNESKAK
jgi:C-terminal processing protease CtpA/Prc